jgi:hypothetical protein
MSSEIVDAVAVARDGVREVVLPAEGRVAGETIYLMQERASRGGVLSGFTGGASGRTDWARSARGDERNRDRATKRTNGFTENSGWW